MPENTVIIAYRNRVERLSAFLPLFESAARRVKSIPKLIICSVGTTDNSIDIYEQWKRGTKTSPSWITVSPEQVPPGPFNKCKALNTCLLHVNTPLVTMLDIDAVILPDFFNSIDGFYSRYPTSRKLCHRVRVYSKSPFTTDSRLIVRRMHEYRLAKEWYAVGDNIVPIREIPHDQQRPILFSKYALGNSHYTCSTEQVMEIGGYNTDFAGWGWEDTEFSARYWYRYHNGTLRTGSKHVVMNRQNEYTVGWNKEENEKINFAKFEDRKSLGFPIPKTTHDWSWQASL